MLAGLTHVSTLVSLVTTSTRLLDVCVGAVVDKTATRLLSRSADNLVALLGHAVDGVELLCANDDATPLEEESGATSTAEHERLGLVLCQLVGQLFALHARTPLVVGRTLTDVCRAMGALVKWSALDETHVDQVRRPRGYRNPRGQVIKNVLFIVREEEGVENAHIVWKYLRSACHHELAREHSTKFVKVSSTC